MTTNGNQFTDFDLTLSEFETPVENVNSVGINLEEPITTLDINGSIRLGNDSIAVPGALRYRRNSFEGFDGVQWRSLDASNDNLGNHLALQSLNLNGNTITNVGAPQNDSDAANRSYVDAHQDGDSDDTNEIQTLSISNNQISLSDGGSVTLPASTNPTWSQVTNKPSGFDDNVDNVDDADNDPNNEIETWSTLSGIPAGFSDNIDNVNDNDSSPNNELLNSATLTDGILKLSEATGSSNVVEVDISSVNYWNRESNNDLIYKPNTTDLVTIEASTGDLGLGGSPTADLHVFQGNNASVDGIVLQNTNDDSSFRLYVSSGTDDLRFYSSSQGTSIIASIDDVSGAYSAMSDRRLKNSIRTIGFDWTTFMQVNPVSYTFKNDPHATPHLGVIAQELEQLYPQFIKYHEEEDLFHVKYSEMSVLAIKAIQEQQKIIEAQKNEVERLSTENDELEVRISRLEKLISKQ